MKGKIIEIQNFGTIILVVLDNGESILFDHRMFQHFAEANPKLIGKTIEYENGIVTIP